MSKIELWPKGLRAHAREIGRIVIVNDGTGTASAGNYNAALSHAGTHVAKPGAWKAGPVRGFSRKASPYHLVQKAILACLWGSRSKAADAMVEMTRDGQQTPGELLTASAEKGVSDERPNP